MEELPNQWPSDDQDLPFPGKVLSDSEDLEYDQIIDSGSAAYPLVNYSGTNLSPDFPVEQQFEPQSPSVSFVMLPFWDPQPGLGLGLRLGFRYERWLLLQRRRQVDERYNQELCCLFNMFRNHKINAMMLDAALTSLEEKYYYSGTDRRRFIRCGDVAGTSLSRLEGAGSSGYPSTSGYHPGTNACGGGVPVGIGLVNNNGDPNSPPGKGKAPYEEGAGNPSTSGGYPPGTHACDGGVHVGIGLVNNNGEPSSSVKHSSPGKGKAPHEEGAGNPSTRRYPPGTNACGGGVPVGIGLVNNNGDPSSRVKHSPPGKGKVPHEEGAGGFANVSGDATGSMNAPREWDLEMGRVNDNNGDPPAPGDVPSSVVPHVAHTANRSGGDGSYVAMTVFSAAASRPATTSMFANSSNIIGVVGSVFAILLADTNRKAATPMLAKASIFACAVGLLADLGKYLPLPLFTGAIISAIFIIIAAMIFAKRLA